MTDDGYERVDRSNERLQWKEGCEQAYVLHFPNSRADITSLVQAEEGTSLVIVADGTADK
jgi:hypothetical protein